MIEASQLPPLTRRFNRRKRIIDLALVVLTAPITIPASLLLAMLIHFRQGPGVWFRQRRLGYLNQEFELIKFRTMTNSVDSDGTPLPDAQRVTPTGRLLRKTSLDELPQLFNIARGDMSFIGPRPLFTRYQSYYTERETTRHYVRPGITGLAQVSGRNSAQWNLRLELDAIYVERASLILDLRIGWLTLLKVMQQKDVSVIAGDSGKPLDTYRTYPRDAELQMRELEECDLPIRVAWMNHPTTRAHMRISDTVTLESTRSWFKVRNRTSGKLDFVVYDRETHDLVAMTGVRDRERGVGESYIFVGPALRGRGKGLRAQRMFLEWAFSAGGYVEILSSIHSNNTASISMHSKFGGTLLQVEDDRLQVRVSKADFLARTRQASNDL